MRLPASLTLLRTGLVAAAVAGVTFASPLVLSGAHPSAAKAPAASSTHSPAPSASATHRHRSATSSTTSPGTRTHVSRGIVRIRGDVGQPQRLKMADLAALPQQTEQVSYTSGSTQVTATFSGPLLLDVLDQAQPSFDPNVKNDAIRFAALVRATDDYQAVVSWGEIDPGFEGKQVLLALTQDGTPLKRPRLVVPGDARGGRYVSDVRGVQLVDLGHGH